MWLILVMALIVVLQYAASSYHQNQPTSQRKDSIARGEGLMLVNQCLMFSC